MFFSQTGPHGQVHTLQAIATGKRSTINDIVRLQTGFIARKNTPRNMTPVLLLNSFVAIVAVAVVLVAVF